MKIENVSGQTLVLPDGTEVPRGGTYEMTKADDGNVAVLQWYEDEWIVEAKPAKAKPSEAKG